MNRRNFLNLLPLFAGSCLLPSWLFKKPQTLSQSLVDFKSLPLSFNPGELTIIAGRPSMGKSAYLLQTALFATLDQNKTVALFTLEESQVDVMSRMLRMRMDVNKMQFKPWNWTDEMGKKLIAVSEALSDSQFYLDDPGVISTAGIYKKARRLQKQVGLDLLLIDSMQLVKSNKTIVEGLKNLAVKLNVPVFATSGVHQVVEHRADKRPQLRDLIGPSQEQVERYADTVITLYRPDYYAETYKKTRQVIEISTLKNRTGNVGTTKLTWDEDLGKFLA